MNQSTSRLTSFLPYLWTCIAIAAITYLSTVIHSIFDQTNIALLYLLPVLLAAVRWGLGVSIFTSILGVLAFDFFFVPPQLNITVSDLRYLLSFLVFLTVALITSTIATRLRDQVKEARQRESRTAALYALSSKITAETDLEKVLYTIVKMVTEIIDCSSFILIPDGCGNLSVKANTDSRITAWLQNEDLTAAKWAFEKERISGKGTLAFELAQGIYFPLKAESRILGVLGLLYKESKQVLSSEQQCLVEAFANLTAVTIMRLQLAEETRQIRYLEESEKLRLALFNSISHDLRTPLASIIGAVTGLLDEGEIYNSEEQRALLKTVKDGGLRLNRVIENLFDMARLESGRLRLNKEWCDLQDILGVVLRQMHELISERKITINCPQNIPLIQADQKLIEQVFINLLENAVKYSPDHSEIQITIGWSETEVIVSIADQGPGIPEADQVRIFDEFYRLSSPKPTHGSGLGLAICKGIIEAHDGRIWVDAGPGAGSRFSFSLPGKEFPPPEDSFRKGWRPEWLTEPGF
ncbi:MAG TPA: DUF4118 domain-containing protein [Bacillota bacterium]|nr:DUF4118 domain-containing protein [Bacillota bacterium]